MKVKETILDLKTRRSIRKFKPGLIAEEELSAILEAGTYAPTGMGAQSPVIVVVKDARMVKKLSKMNAAVMGTTGDPFYGAGTVLVVFADKNRGTYVEDGSLVIGNMLNAAHAVGVGSCWIHRAREEFETAEGRELMTKWGLGSEYVGIGHCILGYADEDPQPKPRKNGYVIID